MFVTIQMVSKYILILAWHSEPGYRNELTSAGVGCLNIQFREYKMDKRFKKLFEPIQIGAVTVPNRIYMPSMCPNYAGPHGESTLQDIGWYEARARGGAGLITIDFTCVSPEGRGATGQRGLWAD